MQKVKLIGYWSSKYIAEWPDPKTMVDGNWDINERDKVIMHLKNGTLFKTYRGYSQCRFDCSLPYGSLGHREYTDGVYYWPEGLSHYLEKHHVRLPQVFVDHVLSYQPLQFSIEASETDESWWASLGPPPDPNKYKPVITTSSNYIAHFENYIAPVYLNLVNPALLQQAGVDEQNAFKNLFMQKLAQADDAIIKDLLWDSNWRGSLTGAWFVFAGNKSEFIDDIGKFLLQGKNAEVGYCYALAKFGTPQAAKYLSDYLFRTLQFTNFPNERFQDLALHALLYIDKIQNTNYAADIIKSGGPWDTFVNFQFHNFKLADYQRWKDEAEGARKFSTTLLFMDSLLSNS